MATLPKSFVPDNAGLPKSFVPDSADEDIAPDTPEQDFGPNHVARNGKGQQVYFDGKLWKDAFTGKQAEGPQQQSTVPGMEKLGALPGIPAPKVDMQYSPYGRTPLGVPMGPVDTTFDTAPGLEKIARGGKQILTAGPTPTKSANVKQLLSGSSNVIEGAFQAGSPLVLPAIAANPVGAAVTLGAGMAADKGVSTGAQALGASPELSRFAGNVAAVLAGGATGRKAFGKLYEAAGSPEVKIGGKFEEPKPFSAMSDKELIAHANKIEAEPPKNYNWQKEQIVQEAAKRQAERGMPAPEEAPKAPASFVPDESPIQGGALTAKGKVRLPKSFRPDTPVEAQPVPVASEAPVPTPTSGQEVGPVVEPPVEMPLPVQTVSPANVSAEPPDGGAASNKKEISTVEENTPSLAAAPPSGGLPEAQGVVAPEQKQEPFAVVRKDGEKWSVVSRHANQEAAAEAAGELKWQDKAAEVGVAEFKPKQTPAAPAPDQVVVSEHRDGWAMFDRKLNQFFGKQFDSRADAEAAAAEENARLAPKPAPVEAKPPDGGAQPTPDKSAPYFTKAAKLEAEAAHGEEIGGSEKTVAELRQRAKAFRDKGNEVQARAIPATPETPALKLKAAAAKNVLKEAEKKAKLTKSEQGIPLRADDVNFQAISDKIGNSLAVHVFNVDNGAVIRARRKVTMSGGLVKTKYLHAVIEHPNGKVERYREQKGGTFKLVSAGVARPTAPESQYTPAELEPDEPLQNKPIEGPTYRKGMSRSQLVAESQVQNTRAGREKYPVLHVNAQAMNILHEAAGMTDGHEIPGVTFTTPQAEEVLRTVNTELRKARLRNKPEEVKKWSEIRDAIEQNRAAAKGRPMIAVQNGTDMAPEEYRRALNEELDHALQIQTTGDIYAHHLGPEGTRAFLDTPEGAKAAETLRRTYGDIGDAQAVLEIGVRLMEPGRHAELRLSPEQANAARARFAELLMERHGVERPAKIVEKFGSAQKKEGVFYGTGNARSTSHLAARRSGSSETPEADGSLAHDGGRGGNSGHESLPERRGTEAGSEAPRDARVQEAGGGRGPGNPERPLQQRNPEDEGPEFRKRPGVVRTATDFFKPVETRLKQEGPPGKELARKLNRAQDIGEVQAGKRVVALKDSGLEKLSRDDRQSLVDALQGFAAPKNEAVQKVVDAVRSITDEIAAEATAADIKVKERRTLRPEDPLPEGAKLTGKQEDKRKAGERVAITYNRPFRARQNFYPHVIPSTDALKSGDVRRDVLANIVRNGIKPNTEEAAAFVDEYRQFIDEGGRSKQLEQYLVESGQARDVDEAAMLLNRFRKRAIKRQGSLEYSRTADLPFYDPDPGRVLPQFITSTSMRLAQVREFGQNNEQLNHLIRIIDKTSGNPGFARMAVDRILGLVNEGNTAEARISRAVRAFNGFKLGLSFIPNATQGALNSFLKSDLPSTLAGAKGLMTASGRRFAMQSGASLEGVVNEMLRSVGADNSALGTFLKGTGFSQTEQANRIWAANAGHAYAKRMLDVLKKNPQDGRARKILTELGLKPDVLLRIGKIDGDAALIAAKKFSDITQFRGGVKDLPMLAASPLGKMVFQFKPFVYGQTRLVYDETVDELKAGRFGRGLRTMLLLATVFPLAGEAIADLRTWMKGGERKTEGIKRWLEDIGQAGSLGVIYDMLDAGGWGKGAEFFAGPALGEAGQIVNIAGGQNKATNAAKWIVKHVPFLGPLFYSRVFPPKEAAQSPAMKKLTGGSKLTRPKLKRKL